MRGREGGRARAASAFPVRIGAFPLLASLCLLTTLALGGGTRPGLLSDVVTQVVAIPLLLWALWKLALGEAGVTPRFGVALVAILVLFPLAQLVPLWFQPPGGVGRQLQSEALALAGHAPPATATVASDVTVLSVISLLPAVAIFIATLVLPPRERRWLAFIVIGYAFVSVLLGLLQLSQGPASPLRFYAITNVEDAVGFFANRNHFSALLNCALVLTSACLLFAASEAGLTSIPRSVRQVAIIAGLTLIISLLAAQAMARSRAGVGIALVALGLSYALMPGLVRPRDAKANPLRALAIAICLGVTLAIQYGAFRTVERFGADPLQDARKLFAQNTFDAILSFLPFGSGLGTFTQVYPSFERLETALVMTYVNRAHNDLVEYALEGGVFAAFVLVAATLYLCLRALRLWRSGRTVTLDLMLQRAAACVLVLILLHSFLDYPLRTGAMLALLAVSAGLLLSAWPEPASEPAVAATTARTGRSASHRDRRFSQRTPDDVSDVGVEPKTKTKTSTPVPRAAWGQDVTWPDAWRTDGKKSSH